MFYTVSFSSSEASEIKKLSGNANGEAGYKDGDLVSAMFNKPKVLLLIGKNNIYIADKSNHVTRKISKSGVTTITGGNVQKAGKADGPTQNASFSDDFELAFDPQRCALLISDHGNRLVRQLDLKTEDCADGSSGSAWGIGVGVACLIRLMVDFAIRPYVLPNTGSFRPLSTQHDMEAFPNQSGERVVTFYCVTRSATASYSQLYQLFKKLLALSFNHVSLVFGFNIIRPRPPPMKPAALLDSDDLPPPMSMKPPVSFLDYDDLGNNKITKTHDLADELKDLITFDGTLNPKLSLDQENVSRVEEKNEVFIETCGKIDRQWRQIIKRVRDDQDLKDVYLNYKSS